MRSNKNINNFVSYARKNQEKEGIIRLELLILFHSFAGN